MSCETCGGTGGVGPDVVLPRSRLAVPGAAGLVLVEWVGDGPLTIQATARQYLFTDARRRLYMTAEDYAAAAAHIDGLVLAEHESVVTAGVVAAAP